MALAAGLFGVQGIRLAAGAGAFVGRDDADGRARQSRPAPRARLPRGGPPSARPLIQDLKNPAARVYEFAAVSPKEPSVVFIADPHADL